MMMLMMMTTIITSSPTYTATKDTAAGSQCSDGAYEKQSPRL